MFVPCWPGRGGGASGFAAEALDEPSGLEDSSVFLVSPAASMREMVSLTLADGGDGKDGKRGWQERAARGRPARSGK